MRITNIEITNFQGLQHAALVVSEPLLLVAGLNGTGKSSLLDGISMAFTGEPRRVSAKKDYPQLITAGAKKAEARVTWLDDEGNEQVCGIMLPTGKGSPLLDAPYLPFVLDAGLFAAQKPDERRRLLFSLSGASATPNEIGKRVEARGLDMQRFEKLKPLLRSGLPAAVKQADLNASEARGAWKATTGENYGSEKAKSWEPDRPPVTVDEAELAVAHTDLRAADQDLAEAQETLGGHKQAAQAAQTRLTTIAGLRDVASLADRRRNKLQVDRASLEDWTTKVTEAEAAAVGEPAHTPMTCPHCKGAIDLKGGQLVAHQPPVKVADAEAKRRLEEYRGYRESAQRTVTNSERDLKESEDAAARITALEAETSTAVSAEAIANGEQAIAELRQVRDRVAARQEALQDAFDAAAQRQQVIDTAAGYHADVVAWCALADALSPGGIPAEILAAAIGPVNDLLGKLSAVAGWTPVQISTDIDVTFGGRLYGLLSESERWRCDTVLAVAIAHLSRLKLLLLDRFDVLDVPSRNQAIRLLRTVTGDGSIDTVIIAGTLKEPMQKAPAGMQAAWLQGTAPIPLKKAG